MHAAMISDGAGGSAPQGGGGAPIVPGLVADMHGHTLHAEVCRAVLSSDPCSEHPPHREINTNHPQAGTALHWACTQGLREAALALLACNYFVMVNAKLPTDGSSALHIAAAEGLSEVVEALLAHPDFTAASDTDNDGFTALHGAAFRKHLRCVQHILACPGFGTAAGVIGMFNVARGKDHWASQAATVYDMRTALHFAAASGSAEVCEEILSAAPLHCMPNMVNRIGATALHIAARLKHTAACKTILRHVEFTAVNARDARGCTALHWAAQQASGDICSAILARDDFTALESRDLAGRTAMNIAKEAGHHEVRRLILARLPIEALTDA